MKAAITIMINGASQPIQAITLQEVLAAEAITEQTPAVAVAVNQCVVPKQQWATVMLQEGDAVDVVHAIAGG